MKYVLEAMDNNQNWHIVGTYELSGAAQADMADYRRIYSHTPLRVVEEPTRVLVLLNNPDPL